MVGIFKKIKEAKEKREKGQTLKRVERLQKLRVERIQTKGKAKLIRLERKERRQIEKAKGEIRATKRPIRIARATSALLKRAQPKRTRPTRAREVRDRFRDSGMSGLGLSDEQLFGPRRKKKKGEFDDLF